MPITMLSAKENSLSRFTFVESFPKSRAAMPATRIAESAGMLEKFVRCGAAMVP